MNGWFCCLKAVTTPIHTGRSKPKQGQCEIARQNPISPEKKLFPLSEVFCFAFSFALGPNTRRRDRKAPVKLFLTFLNLTLSASTLAKNLLGNNVFSSLEKNSGAK